MPKFDLYDLIANSSPIHIVDVGAAFNENGDEPYKCLVDKDRAIITGFEPDQDACDALNNEFDGTENQCFPYFIGDGNDGTLHTFRDPLCNSLYAPNRSILDLFGGLDENPFETGTHPVSTKRLDDVPDLSNVDFLKLDVQGSELDVLQGAVRVLSEAVVVFTEVEFVEMYLGQPLFGDITKYLHENDYMFHRITGVARLPFKPLVKDGDPTVGVNQPLWGDTIFIRDPRGYDTIPTEKLLKLALIMHELVGSIDLTLRILAIVDECNDSRLRLEYLDRF